MARLSVLAFLFILLQHNSSAQVQLRETHRIKGVITDSKSKAVLSEASVYIPDLKTGAVSKADGGYLVKNIPKGICLVEVSFVGYASQYKEVDFKETVALDFNLEQTSAESPEVVVTGVSSATERRLNPAPVSFVTRSDMRETSSNNIIDALSNAPGVSQITMGLPFRNR